MGNEKEKGSLLSFSGLVVFLAALGVIVFTNVPFRGSRPPVQEIRETFEKVPARLWQDPFLAVLDYERLSEKSPPLKSAGHFMPNGAAPDGKTVESSLARRIREKSKEGKVTVLGVMVTGGPYAEDTEMRIRQRYAVLSGLRRLGFVPVDSMHIDFITVGAREKENGNFSLSSVMPFEWFARERKENDSVLLLWINDDVFQEAPLARLGRLAGYLGLDGGKSGSGVKFKVFGPAGSTGLREMLEEPAPDGRGTSAVEIFSYMATVDDALLLESAGVTDAGNAKNAIEEIFARHGIRFTRTIGSDRKLAGKLIDELELRNVDCGKDHIALVAEWDTFYGRSLPDIYKRALMDRGLPRDRVDAHVHAFSYLRGLDGSIPGEKEEKNDNVNRESGAQDGGAAVSKLEQPLGKSQYDYLRRLADEIYRLDQELGRGSIKAIGVVGSDFYDKYLALQALRQRFPQAVFFTTDLDARLLHPDNIKWTRNLVVASNFNLALRKDERLDIQGDVPPFRDNYQTSAFYAVLRAFPDDNYLEKNVAQALKQESHPLIFEIGRHKALDLTSEGGSENTVHPVQRQADNVKKFFLKSGCIALLLFGLLCLTSVSVKQFLKSLRAGRPRWTAALIVVFLTVNGFLFFRVLGNPAGEEPFSLFEGVSVWPTDIIRLIASAFSFFFLWYSRSSLKNNIRDIDQEFALRPSPSEDDGWRLIGGRGPVSRFVKKHLENLKYDWNVPDNTGGITINRLWNEYLRRDSLASRLPRLGVVVIPYIILCWAIISFDKPLIPVRGGLSRGLDMEMLVLCVALFTVLNFYVFDIARTCRRFINIAEEKLAEGKLKWSPVSVRRFAPDSREDNMMPVHELMLVHLIAKHTEAVGKLIFYPFIVWSVIFISRISYFDNWQTPIGLAVVITMGALFAWSSAFILRRSAEHARMDAIHRLTTRLAAVLSNKAPEPGEAELLRHVLGEVTSVRQGAFAPFTQHPVVQAFFVPFGGIGSVYLMEFLGKLNL